MRAAAGGLASVLAAYFLLLPLRESAALSLGTRFLPVLFTVSLCATAIVSPIAAVAVSRVPRRRGHQVSCSCVRSSTTNEALLCSQPHSQGGVRRPSCSALPPRWWRCGR